MLNKALQTKFYNFLATRWGVAIFIIGLFFSFNSVLQLLTAILDEQTSHYSSIQNPSFQPTCHLNHKGPIYEDIDVVFTWVNGSDPRHKAALQAMKLEKLGEIERVCNGTEIPEEHNCTRDEETLSRFTDNEELRYALRSIEKNMNWVRNIYLVTNGQIPYWMNLSHPRLSIVTHEQIFANKSHLPTFSSPAIEANLHRIPGLARKFVYFNDDTMIGDTVYPDDFETKSGGQKVFLAWGVPNCAEGCPSSWIGDGFCDQACNSSACDWDGGDCANVTADSDTPGGNYNGGSYNGGFSSALSSSDYCSTGCPNSWIGDKFCDRTCRVANCGFDAGDCDIEELSTNLHGVMIEETTDDVVLPKEILAAYFNLTKIIGKGKVLDGSHDNTELIRTATISQKHRIITLTFNRNIPSQLVTVEVNYQTEDGTKMDLLFNVTHSTLNNDTQSNPLTSSTEHQQSPLQSDQSPLQEPEKVNEDPNDDLKREDEDERVDIEGRKEKENELEGIQSPKKAEEEESSTIKSRHVKGDYITVSKSAEDLNELNEIAKPKLEDEKAEEDPKVEKTLGRNSRKDEMKKKRIRSMKQKLDEIMSKTSETGRKLMSSEEGNEGDRLELLAEKFTKFGGLSKEVSLNLLTQFKKKNGNLWEQKLEKKINEMETIFIEQKYRLDQSKISENGEIIWPWEDEFEEKGKEEDAKQSTGRKLMDNYGESLKFVNSLMNAAFGSTARKVPAHMPHFLSLDVLEDLHKQWPDKWNETSSHQFRSGEDMQFAFSYFYFMIHQLNEFNLTNIWTTYLDTNTDGYLNTNELRTLAAHLGPLPLANDSVIILKEQLLNCSEGGLISLPVLQNCEIIFNQVKEHFSAKPKNRHELLDTEQVAFLMIGLNHTNVEAWLDGVRERRHKFICLNDNLNYSDPRAPEVLKVVKNFYTSLFPHKSSFELADGVENPFLHLDEFPEPYMPFGRKSNNHEEASLARQKKWILFAVFSLFGCAACVAFWRTKGGDESAARRNREKRFLVMMNTA
eukprot:TRINITY_DN3721_c0_g1_i2.p1 TRINITY_DN3721_c0_g1~~TRINITY_DN3721_c0_g1_i2.p1  ORF type:complete len:1019 (-),score=326.23 TRINITY_DN3721_c0_g1_i2:164-3220(-)